MVRRSVLAGLALGLAVTVAGCGGGDPEAGTSAATEPTPTTVESSAISESPGPGGGTGSPGEATGGVQGDTYRGATPASGQQITAETAVISVPADWPQDPAVDATTTVILGPSPDYSVSLSEGLQGQASTTDDLVAVAMRFGSYTDAVQRLDDVTIAGAPAYHLLGPDELFTSTVVDEFGLISGGMDFTIRVATPKGLDQAARDSLVGTVLASFQLTSA